VSDGRCEPFDVAPGAAHLVRLPPRVRGGVPAGSTVTFVRGRRIHARARSGRDGAVSVALPVGAVQGVYKAVVTTPDGTKIVCPEALRVIDPARHEGVVIPDYDRWHYLLGSDGVPIKDIGGDVGYVRHPLVATYYALHFIAGSPSDMPERERSRRLGVIVDWLVAQSVPGPRGSLCLPNRFPLPGYGLAPGWISGLTQGRFADVCVRMFQRTKDSAWRDRARAACRAMFVPVSEGGLLAIDRFGDCCIEEYAIEPPNWALNGIGSAIASLRHVHQAVGLDGAEDLIDRVAASLDRKMDLFDCPDVPGSRVQLALPYSVTLSADKGLSSISIDALALTGPDLVQRSLVPADAFAESIDRGECRVEAGNVVFTGRSASFALVLDGNRDARKSATAAPHGLELRWNAIGRGSMTATVACGKKVVELARTDVLPGSGVLRVSFDANTLVPGGVGRIARYDETYHETNLIWMSDISGGGARPRSRHAMRRWVLSFCTGVGRVPVRCGEELRLAIDRAIAGRCGLATPSAVLERELLRESKENSRDGGAVVEAVSPSVIVGAPAEFRVLGIGFAGDEKVAWTAADGSTGEARVRVLGGDELLVSLLAAPIGALRITVRRGGAVLAEETIFVEDSACP
jgi:hypothetical protein